MPKKPKISKRKLSSGLTPMQREDLLFVLADDDPDPWESEEHRRHAWEENRETLIDEFRFSVCGNWNGMGQRPMAYWEYDHPEISFSHAERIKFLYLALFNCSQ